MPIISTLPAYMSSTSPSTSPRFFHSAFTATEQTWDGEAHITMLDFSLKLKKQAVCQLRNILPTYNDKANQAILHAATLRQKMLNKFAISHSPFTDTEATNPSTDFVKPSVRQHCGWSIDFEVSGMTPVGREGEKYPHPISYHSTPTALAVSKQERKRESDHAIQMVFCINILWTTCKFLQNTW